jgi:hypothetical protein
LFGSSDIHFLKYFMRFFKHLSVIIDVSHIQIQEAYKHQRERKMIQKANYAE